MSETTSTLDLFIENLRRRDPDYSIFLSGLKADPARIGKTVIARSALTSDEAYDHVEDPYQEQEFDPLLKIDEGQLVRTKRRLGITETPAERLDNQIKARMARIFRLDRQFELDCPPDTGGRNG